MRNSSRNLQRSRFLWTKNWKLTVIEWRTATRKSNEMKNAGKCDPEVAGKGLQLQTEKMRKEKVGGHDMVRRVDGAESVRVMRDAV